MFYNLTYNNFRYYETENDGMPFHTESTGYEKTILSDLQGAWINFRSSVADNAGSSLGVKENDNKEAE